MNSKFYLAFESASLFIGMPVLFYYELLPVPKIAALLAVTLVCVLVLRFDGRHEVGRLLTLPEAPNLKGLGLRAAAVALLVFVLVRLLQPAGLLAFPRQEPVIWMAVMLLYPLLSALPQELIYRSFFFERYRPLFRDERFVGYASAVAFAFLHIVYDNGWAPGLSLAGGLLFARTYRQTRSLLWVSVEHALYGWIVFTIGLGNYFYEPF